MKTPQQHHQELHDQRSTDASQPYSLCDRMTAARLAEQIPAGPSRDYLLHVATGNDNPPRKEIQP